MGLSGFTIGYMPSTIALMIGYWSVQRNMTASGLSYPHHGNLEILCEPGPPFVPAVFEAALKRESSEVSDDDFRIWQRCPVIERELVPSIAALAENDLDEWIPQTRNPDYIWMHYSGNEGGTLKKCVNSQAVYPLSEQHGLEAQERR